MERWRSMETQFPGNVISWKTYYEEDGTVDNSKILSEETFAIYFLPNSICLIDIAQRYGMISDHIFESAKWKVLGTDSLEILGTSHHFSIGIQKSSNAGWINGEQVLMEMSKFNVQDGDPSEQGIWREVEGKWQTPNNSAKEGLFEVDIDNGKVNLMISIDSKIIANGRILYFIPSAELLLVYPDDLYQIVFGVEEGEEKVSSIYLDFLNSKGKQESIILNR
jgi:hypothetical protein